MNKLLFVQPQYSVKYIIDYLSPYFEITGLFTKDPRPYYPLDKSMFSSCHLLFDMSDDEVLKQFAPGQFDFVINGTDASEELACKIANLVCPNRANQIDPLNKRWNKFYSIEALKNAGIASTWQKSITVDKIMNGRLGEKDLQFPCFIKPVNLVGGVGTGICYSLEDAKRIIKSTPSEFCGLKLSEVLFQEIYTGDEYALDCFSFNGQHEVAYVTKYIKDKLDNGRTYYRSIEPLDPHGELFKRIQSYITQVLNAVGFSFGISHIEIFYDSAKDKFSLVEINPRAPGAAGQFMNCAKLLRGFNVLDLLLDKICGIPYIEKKTGLYVDYVTLYAGNIRKIGDVNLELLNTISSIVSYVKVKPNGYIASNDYTLADAIMFVTIANTDSDQLLKDKLTLFDLEKQQVLF